MGTTSTLTIDLTRIDPEEGLLVEGELASAVFDLHDGFAKPLSGLKYRLHLMMANDCVVAHGMIAATFEVRCGRTLEWFPYEVKIDPYAESLEIENPSTLDLTDRLREDILLALPSYPVSPGADAEVFTSPEAGSLVDEVPFKGSLSAWDALDGLSETGSK